MNTQISFQIKIKDLPKEISDKIVNVVGNLKEIEDELREVSDFFWEVDDEEDFYEISQKIAKTEEQIEHMQDLQQFLSSYRNLMLNYVKIKKDMKSKEEVLHKYGPNSLKVANDDGDMNEEN